MEVSVENTSTLGRKIKVSVPDEAVTAQIKAKMAKLAKNAHIKGFRKGKIPPRVLEQKFGDSVRLEVVNELIRETLGDALKQKELQLAGMPRIDEVKNQVGKDLEYVASCEVYPQIVLADCSDIEIEKRIVDITESDVLNMIEKLKDQLAHWLPVERTIHSGDKLNVDFARLLKESSAKREEQKNVSMIVGAEGVLPGLSEALLSKQKGETIEIELSYPVDWADLPAAGKEVTLWVTVNEITEKQVLSEEELAKRFGIENDSEALQKIIRNRMQEELNQVLQDELKETVLEKLLEKNPIEIPQSLVEQEKEAIRREVSRQRRTNVQKEELHTKEVELQAIRRVELGLLLNEVIHNYDLKADGLRVRSEIEKISAKFPKPTEIVEAYYGNKELLNGIERMVLLEQAVAALLKDIKVTEKSASFDEVMNPVTQNDS